MQALAFDLHGTLAIVDDHPILIANLEVLRTLSNSYTLVLITSCPRELALRTLESTGLSEFFPPKQVIADEDISGSKESGEPFIEAKRRFPTLIGMIGDQPQDASGAAKAGLPSVLLPRTRSLEERTAVLTKAISNVTQETN